MNQNKYIFAQLIDFLSHNDFQYIVRKFKGNKGVRNFTCWNQLLMMMFGQLSNCDSMRDLCILIDAHHQNAYRLGFGKSVSLSTLSRANANRLYEIFEEFASLMIAKAKKCLADSEIASFAASVERHEEKIRNYLRTGKTNAAAENMNSKLQRFITANYGTRDIEFFLFRTAKYFS